MYKSDLQISGIYAKLTWKRFSVFLLPVSRGGGVGRAVSDSRKVEILLLLEPIGEIPGSIMRIRPNPTGRKRSHF